MIILIGQSSDNVVRLILTPLLWAGWMWPRAWVKYEHYPEIILINSFLDACHLHWEDQYSIVFEIIDSPNERKLSDIDIKWERITTFIKIIPQSLMHYACFQEGAC